MIVREAITKNRSYRRFYEDVVIEAELLVQWIDLARLSASSRNIQSVKFMPVCQPQQNAKIFRHLAWAGYIDDWEGPAQGERPSAYIVILGDKNIANTSRIDVGIASQSILLGAVADGYGGCMVASVNRDELQKSFRIPEHLEIILVIALGKPKEEVVIEPAKNDDIKYWRDSENIHHVPKRSLKELLVKPCQEKAP